MTTQVLTQTDINNLSAFSQNGSFGDYYGLLANKGYTYAELALDVVNSQGGAGGVARAFAENIGNITGGNGNISATEWANISLELMQADFVARDSIFNSGNTDVTLPVSIIRDYHTAVFANHSLPAHAWTAYVPTVVDVTSTSQEEHIWSEILLAGSNWVVSAFFGLGSSVFAAWDSAVDNFSIENISSQWFLAMHFGEYLGDTKGAVGEYVWHI